MSVSVELATKDQLLTQPSNGRVLYSWKEIAAFLKCSVRSVQRWEREESLPVHRHSHKRRCTIYARSGELEQWLSTRELASTETLRTTLESTTSARVTRRRAAPAELHSLADKLRFNQAKALLALLETGLTFARIGMGTLADSARRARMAAHASRIYDRVIPVIQRTSFTTEEAKAVTDQLNYLQLALRQLQNWGGTQPKSLAPQ